MSDIVLRDIKIRRGQELILDLPELAFPSGSQTLLTGGSGSGKSTLIHLLAGFLAPQAGSYTFGARELSGLAERQWDRFRASHIGVIFQHYPLLRGFHLLDNLLIPMGIAGQADTQRAATLLRRVGLEHRMLHRPAQLSAGQRQRAALVRAVANKPALLLADEPTAHLDPENAATALALLRELVAELGCTLLLVSHDHSLTRELERHFRLEDLNRVSCLPRRTA
jgi:putative ABC transport system ATP-binding protein